MILYLIICKEDEKIIDVFSPFAYDCTFDSYFYHYYDADGFRWIKINFLNTTNKTKGDLMCSEVLEVSNG